jgi:hypothetical protein
MKEELRRKRMQLQGISRAVIIGVVLFVLTKNFAISLSFALVILMFTSSTTTDKSSSSDDSVQSVSDISDSVK